MKYLIILLICSNTYAQNVYDKYRYKNYTYIDSCIVAYKTQQLYYEYIYNKTPDNYIYDIYNVRKITSDILQHAHNKPDSLRAICKYIVSNFRYDYEYANIIYKYNSSNSTYGQLKVNFFKNYGCYMQNKGYDEFDDIRLGFMRKKLVCGGYSKLFKMMCGYAGIECYRLYGNVYGGYHGWNVVNIEKTSLWFDLTRYIEPYKPLFEKHYPWCIEDKNAYKNNSYVLLGYNNTDYSKRINDYIKK